MLQLASLTALPRALREAGLVLDDFVRHMAWVWTFMFERLVPHEHPAGRMVLVADCSAIRLSLAMGEGQVGRAGAAEGARIEHMCGDAGAPGSGPPRTGGACLCRRSVGGVLLRSLKGTGPPP
jgi:hypothetical protein